MQKKRINTKLINMRMKKAMPWMYETNIRIWEQDNLLCVALRIFGHGGWCGYVGLNGTIPSEQVDSIKLPDKRPVRIISLREGWHQNPVLNYVGPNHCWVAVDFCQQDDVYPLNFLTERKKPASYKTIEYVINTVNQIAEQLLA